MKMSPIRSVGWRTKLRRISRKHLQKSIYKSLHIAEDFLCSAGFASVLSIFLYPLVLERKREMSGFVFYSMLAVLIIWMLEKLLVIFWWKPRKIQKLFLDQGIKGPEYRPFIGSLGELAKIYANAEAAQLSVQTNKANLLSNPIHLAYPHLSQYIIAKVIFGNDIDEGLQIVRLHSEQAAIASKTVKIFYIPGTRFIPTALHRRSKWLRREVEKKFHVLIERRLQCVNPKENDWLSLMLSSGNMTRQQIIDQCGVFLIAGSESTGILLAWACLHLGSHKIWQEKARDEIQQVLLKDKRPIVEILSHFKILNMIIHETLRLYPSAPFVMKHSQENIKLGGLTIPAGIDIMVPIIAVHQDTTIWGHNAAQFDPGRFSKGISKASKHPLAFMPFMQGPRICMGINFAMTEARVILAMILLNFDITISPRYKHVPVGGITLQLGHGAVLLLRKI